MAQILSLPFGSGKDGTVPASGTYGGTNLSCSGTSGSTTLTYSGTFTAGDIVLIHQSRGTGVGQWELNQIASANTLVQPLSYTYTDSGASQAQVIEVKEYSGGTISGTLTCNTWNENTGGILPIMINGKLIVSGSLNATGKGYDGASGITGANNGYTGEGNVGGGGTSSVTRNGTGGSGGGFGINGSYGSAGGAGGGHATAGGNGDAGIDGDAVVGQGGTTGGSADLTTAIFGGAGGSGGGMGGEGTVSGVGGNSGGAIFLFAKEISITGSVISSGNNGQSEPVLNIGSGGGGSGGSILIKSQTASIGTNLVVASGGSGGVAGVLAGNGGAGGNGRIRIEACNLTGSTSPTASSSIGGQDYCSSFLGGMI